MYQTDTSIKTNNGHREDLFVYNKRREELTLIKVGITCQDKYRLSSWRKSLIIPQMRKLIMSIHPTKLDKPSKIPYRTFFL